MILLGTLGLALLEIVTSGCKQSREALWGLKTAWSGSRTYENPTKPMKNQAKTPLEAAKEPGTEPKRLPKAYNPRS